MKPLLLILALAPLSGASPLEAFGLLVLFCGILFVIGMGIADYISPGFWSKK